MIEVPSDVKVKIRDKASSEWPDDYEMQKHVLETQIEAYRAVEDLKSRLGTHEIFQIIVDKAVREWPDDFEMQLHVAAAHSHVVDAVH